MGVDEAVPNPDPKSPDVLEVLKISAQSSPEILSDLGLNRPLQSEKVETSENSLEMIKEKSKLLQLDPNGEIKGKIRTYGGPMPSKDSGWPKDEFSYDQPNSNTEAPANLIESEIWQGGRAYSGLFSEGGGGSICQYDYIKLSLLLHLLS